MAIRLKVKDGTRPDVRLCDSCRFSIITKGSQQGQEIVYCTGFAEDKVIPFKVVECTKYSCKGEMSEWEAKEVGWVLEVKAGKVMGFKPPKKEYENG